MSLSFFFSSRRRHTRCALVTGVQTCALPILYRTSLRQKKRAAEATPDLPQRCGRALFGLQRQPAKTLVEARDLAALIEQTAVAAGPDRKSVVEGKSVSVRVDLGGRRIITKKTTHY